MTDLVRMDDSDLSSPVVSLPTPPVRTPVRMDDEDPTSPLVYLDD